MSEPMTLEAYFLEARRTMTPDPKSTAPAEVCYALGLAGELQEYREAFRQAEAEAATKNDGGAQWRRERPQRMKALEELGDVCWYAAAITDFFGGWPTEDLLIAPSGVDLSHVIDLGVGAVCEALKKKHAHGKPINMLAFGQSLRSIWSGLYLECEVKFGEPMTVVLEMNVAKLRKRYPNGFSHAAAVGGEVRPSDASDEVRKMNDEITRLRVVAQNESRRRGQFEAEAARLKGLLSDAGREMLVENSKLRTALQALYQSTEHLVRTGRTAEGGESRGNRAEVEQSWHHARTVLEGS